MGKFWQAWSAALALSFAGLAAAGPAHAMVHKVGAVTWHAARYAGRSVDIAGYVLVMQQGYVLFSDEPTGKVSAHDLPVTGADIGALRLHKKYRLRGTFMRGGLKASNGNPYHLELAGPPVALGH